MVLRKSALLLLLVAVTASLFASEINEDPMHRKMLDIAKDLRCAVCQNQPVSESNSELATDMRAIIREQLEAGKDRREITDYFVERYGDYVLMKPPVDQSSVLLWIAPVLFLGGMAVGAWVFMRNRQRVEPAPLERLSDEDRARVRAAEQADPEGIGDRREP